MGFSYYRFQKHLNQDIGPELGWPGCWYQMNTVQPVIEVVGQV